MQEDQLPVMGLEELEAEAARFAAGLSPRADGATLVTLSGELGAGKTTFAQAMARALGVVEPVTSPTFVIAKSYALPEGSLFARLVHMDAYRLEGAPLEPTGFPEAMRDPGTLVLLEWPELAGDALPEPAAAVRLETVRGTQRSIAYA